jgi:hypothetical protein
VSRLRRVIGGHDWTDGERVYYFEEKMHTVPDSPKPASSFQVFQSTTPDRGLDA